MGCGEKKGESITFDSFEANTSEHISVDEANAQEKKAEKTRAAEGE